MPIKYLSFIKYLREARAALLGLQEWLDNKYEEANSIFDERTKYRKEMSAKRRECNKQYKKLKKELINAQRGFR